MFKKSVVIVFLLVINFSFSQQKEITYNRAFIIYPGCEDNFDKPRCFEMKLHRLFEKHLNKNTLKDSIFAGSKKDTIVVYATTAFNEQGKIVKKFSSVWGLSTFVNKQLKPILIDSLPVVKPFLDSYDNGVASIATKTLGFLLDRNTEEIIPILGYTPPVMPFAVIEKAPIYKGCDESLNNKELKKCMSEKISEVVSRSFRSKLVTKLGLSPGLKRIFVAFKVGKDGRITDIIARAPHKKLEEEAIRVVKKIPKLKKPGYQKGKPVIVSYSLPIVFRVSN